MNDEYKNNLFFSWAYRHEMTLKKMYIQFKSNKGVIFWAAFDSVLPNLSYAAF